jgi:hypothetical protein
MAGGCSTTAKCPQMSLEFLGLQSFASRSAAHSTISCAIVRLAKAFVPASIHTLLHMDLDYHLYTEELQEVIGLFHSHPNTLRSVRITPWSINPQLLQFLANSLPRIQQLVINSPPLLLSDGATEHEKAENIVKEEPQKDM